MTAVFLAHAAAPATALAAPCDRSPLPPLVGVNVVDLPDDQDGDPENDGARGYGSDAARATLDRVRQLRGNAVVLPVELRADARGKSVRPGVLLQHPTRLGRMIDDAKARGLRVVLAAHLHLDGDGWRGDLAPGAGTDDDAAAFFAAYAAALSPLAALAEERCADALSVAVEFKALSKRPAVVPAFAQLVAGVRARFSGAVVYSANWDEVEAALWWPHVDVVGVNAFHPLSGPLAGDGPATADAMTAVAARHQRAAAAVAAVHQKPLWFMELGFKAVAGTSARPWEWPGTVAPGVAVDGAAQAAAFRAVFAAAAQTRALSALFVWAAPADVDDARSPGPFEGPHGFNVLGKPAEREVSSYARRVTSQRARPRAPSPPGPNP